MDPRTLRIADFTYELPEERIAQQPLAERDASRLLVWRDGAIADRCFRDLPAQLPCGALLVLNNTRVVNARLVFQRATGARIEVLCLEPDGQQPVEQAFGMRHACVWKAFVGNAKRWKDGEALALHSADGAVVLHAERIAAEQVRFRWSPGGWTFAEVLERFGHVPLPPYMKRPDDAADKQRYNTVFAARDGSVAAPTASLHFTPAVLQGLSERGVRTTEIALHVGAGTFLPVKGERMDQHEMHGEQVRIPLGAIEALLNQPDDVPVVAVGTTALRTLESLYWHGVDVLDRRAGPTLAVDQWRPYAERTTPWPAPKEALAAVATALRTDGAAELAGRTQLLIAPPYVPRMAQGLITNFHQPQSTLLLLVAAFAGPEWRAIYRHALDAGYRFLSYGDGSLLWRSSPR
jgi:S-adenosylmethionine:tRNA ribosyltransferase-isomerase